jgi:hypothetical protein
VGRSSHEPEIDSCDFGNLRRADVCAGSTAKRSQVEGAGGESHQNHHRRQAQEPDLLQIVELNEQIDQWEAPVEAQELRQKRDKLGEKLGPEYVASWLAAL